MSLNSALKPVLPQPGVPQTGSQSSPAKANVANANHAVGLPQGAQNSVHHASNNLVGQNLIQHIPNTPPPAVHAVPSMAPVSANMAQMAQNMSHHGNLSHVTQNSVTPVNVAASPTKSATTSAPLSLVQDKASPSQPLALTRTPEKKEVEAGLPNQSNGTIESPKSASNATVPLKPQNPENKDKQDIAKASLSATKPPEKPQSAPSTPQKQETPNPTRQSESPAQPRVATANEAPEKSPVKPTELKPTQTGDVAPTQSDSKPLPESAHNESQQQEKPQAQPVVIQLKESVSEGPKPEFSKSEESTESKVVKAISEPKQDVEKVEPPKQEESKLPKEEKIEEKEVKSTPSKAEVKVIPKSTLKLATVTPPMRKRRQVSDKLDGATPAKKATEDSTPEAKSKRNRTQVQLYQSPTPDIAMATKLSASAGRSTPTKPNDEKLIVFYKNEYLAVRNAEGGFYVCQALHNVYRTTRKIKIRWLSQDKSDSSGETYKPDFYDITDMECVLTTLSLTRSSSGGGAWLLKAGEQARATSILERALRAEQSGTDATPLTPEHPDGLDLSLYKDESQLDKKSRKRNHSKASPGDEENDDDSSKEDTPPKKARTTPKRSPRSPKKGKKTPKPATTATPKGKGSPPVATGASKVGIVRRIYRNTATAVTEKAKSAPAKQTPSKPSPKETPPRQGRRAGKESKSATPIPSTSTGKATRTPRKPPSKK
ncbi:unnamed protein product [Leptidea sinapis]|uniref:Uncharacterized protein n=1 Tax=Leptidea sinapis TaxID=189913 RepID=A0A5E4QIL3_9NEOP|nr:unnamed protein product [Leptidea sinapis]